MDGRSDVYDGRGRLQDEPDDRDARTPMPAPSPAPISAMVTLRPDVANALEILKESLRDEDRARDDWGGTVPLEVRQTEITRAMGWRVFCVQAFTELLADQIAQEMKQERERQT